MKREQGRDENGVPTLTFSSICVECGEPWAVVVYEEDWARYAKGDGYIQDIFNYLSSTDRELLKTGICGVCWDKMFSEDVV